MDLQQEIISASSVKQPWLFIAIITKYIKCVLLLSKIQIQQNSKEEDTISIDVFEETSYNNSYINSNEYKKILIKSSQVQNAVLKHIIKLIGNSICLFVDNDFGLIKASTDSILQALDIMNLSIKCTCIQFITKLIRKSHSNHFSNDPYLFHVVKLTLQSILQILQQMQMWLNEKLITNAEIEHFYEVSGKFFGCKDIVKYCDTGTNCTIAINVCLNILKVNLPKPTKIFLELLYTLMSDILIRTDSNEFTNSIKLLFTSIDWTKLIPSTMMLLENIILKKLKFDHENEDNILNMIELLTDNILCNASSCSNEDDFIGNFFF